VSVHVCSIIFLVDLIKCIELGWLEVKSDLELFSIIKYVASKFTHFEKIMNLIEISAPNNS
jgi:hypothetical protein